MENDNSSKEKSELPDFKISIEDPNDIDDEYERTLEKDIENNCEFNIYVNKLEIPTKTDNELLFMEKHEIIDFKNYQIQKLKGYIVSLEKEKEDLIENFKNTTNILIEKLKENEFQNSGIRPQTPFITKNLNKIKEDRSNSFNSTSKERCPNCTKEFPQDIFFQHSLDCLRNKIKCKKCGELIDQKFKKEHLLEWRSNEVI